MTLSPDQIDARDDIIYFLDPSNPNREHILTGSPGMGKSYLTSLMVDEAHSQDIVPVLTATTNKATGVLEAFYKSASLLGMQTMPLIGTIHKVLNLRVQTDYVKNTTQIYRNRSPAFLEKHVKEHVNKQNGRPKNYSIANPPILLIVDEASMIDKELYKFIKESMDQFPLVKILYVGDKNQLPPVNGVSVVFDPSNGIPVSRLTTVHRQKPGSTLELVSRSIEKAIESKSWFIDPMQSSSDIEVIKDPTTFFNALNSYFNSPDFATNPNHVRALAYRNKTVNQFNKHIRDLFYTVPDFQIGERLIVNKAYFEDDLKHASTEDIVTVADIDIGQVEGIDGHKLMLQHEDGRTFEAFHTVHKRKIAMHRKKLIKGEQFRDLMRFMETFIDVRPVYASTIHKSQGSTYENVFLDLTDVAACPNYKEMAHLIFVALTRAREKVYVYGDTPNILRK